MSETNVSVESGLTPEQAAILATLHDPDAIQEQTFPFGAEMHRAILAAIIVEPGFVEKVHDHVKPEYFIDHAHRLICKLAIEHYNQYRSAPSESVMWEQVRAATDAMSARSHYQAELKTLYDEYVQGLYPTQFLLDKVRDFSRTQKYRLALDKIVTALKGDEENKWSRIDELHRRAVAATEQEGTIRRGYSVEELEAMPNPDYLIEDHVPDKALALLYGPSGAGKSFVTIDMGLSVATGMPYLGKFGVRQGKVLYVCSEGVAGAKLRVRAWMRDKGVQVPIKKDQFCLLPCSFDLLQDAEVDAILTIARRDLGGMPDLTVIDTLARNFGGDENATKDMVRFVRSLDRLRTETGGAVVPVHHTGKDLGRNERGNNSLRCACDQIIYVEKVDQSFTAITCEKNKDREEWAPYRVEKKVHNFSELGADRFGKPYTSLSLGYAGLKSEDKIEERSQTLCRSILAFLGTENKKRADLVKHFKPEGFGRDMVDQHIKILKEIGAIYSGHDGYRVNDGGEMLYEISLARANHASEPSGSFRAEL